MPTRSWPERGMVHLRAVRFNHSHRGRQKAKIGVSLLFLDYLYRPPSCAVLAVLEKAADRKPALQATPTLSSFAGACAG